MKALKLTYIGRFLRTPFSPQILFFQHFNRMSFSSVCGHQKLVGHRQCPFIGTISSLLSSHSSSRVDSFRKTSDSQLELYFELHSYNLFVVAASCIYSDVTFVAHIMTCCAYYPALCVPWPIHRSTCTVYHVLKAVTQSG